MQGPAFRRPPPFIQEDSSRRQTRGARFMVRAAPKSFVEVLRCLRWIRFFMPSRVSKPLPGGNFDAWALGGVAYF
jgi:hypothetical protein